MSKHKKCTSISNDDLRHGQLRMPKRVIDVGASVDFGWEPRLIETERISAPYVCLSHRWEHSPKLKTTRRTLRDHQRAIPAASMPPTFHQAIKITRNLAFRYLWIDSLCIVQDDDDEWQSESKRMGVIFASATCTIAAMDAVEEGVDCGLFLTRKDPLAVTLSLPLAKEPCVALSQKIFTGAQSICVWKYYWLQDRDRTDPNSVGPSVNLHTVVLRPRTYSLPKLASWSAWYNRGWVFQERILSRRMIFFAKEKIYWSCFAMIKDEEGGDPTDADRDVLLNINCENAARKWQMLLSQYVRSSLTYSKDRLAAIEGVATIFSKILPDGIHAGVADDGTGESLLWYTEAPATKSSEEFHVPSWSWASLKATISFWLDSPHAQNHSCLLQDIVFRTIGICPMHNPKGLCKNTCISGRLSLLGPAQTLYRSMRLRDCKFEGYVGDPMEDDNLLSFLLGSAAYSTGHTPVRVRTDGTPIHMPRRLYVPEHTELLADSYGHILGFMIPDTTSYSEQNRPVVCVGVKLWQSSLPDTPQCPETVAERDACMEEIDVICLELGGQSPRRWNRIGRGRIMCNSWLSSCKIDMFTIV